MSGVIHINSEEEFKKEVLSYDGLTVIDFRAERCGPCRMLGPIMDELVVDNAGKNVKIVKVNVDESPTLAGAFQVSSIPAIFFIKWWQPVDFMVWVSPKNVFQAKIDQHAPAAEWNKTVA